MATDSAFIGLLSIALQAVSSKALVLLSMLITGGLYGWTMYLHDLIALAVAATWSVLVFLPILWRTGERNAKVHSPPE